jgi:hypothetical protein
MKFLEEDKEDLEKELEGKLRMIKGLREELKRGQEKTNQDGNVDREM